MKITKILSISILAVLLFVAVLPLSCVFAEATVYSDALDDLQIDDKFDASAYPLITSDYSLKLIQIAESVNSELFVYVYQPSGNTKNYRASSMSLSTTINDNISFLDYKLEYLNNNGVFFKYKVKDFTVKTDAVRYYEITCIRRPFDEAVDTQASGNNTITEVDFDVSKLYAFGEINGKPYVNCVDVETIKVTDKFVGFVRYKDGFKLYSSACDSHFVAFDTDKPIDTLLEADVYYTAQEYSWSFVLLAGEKETFKDKQDKYAHPTSLEKVEHKGDGLFAGSYTWDRIQTVSDFIATENREEVFHGAVLDVKVATKLTDTAMENLKTKKWVLRFAETSYSYNSFTTGSSTSYSTLVGDVTILRLKFVTAGITYNLGVVDNKQTGSNEPSNETDVSVVISEKFNEMLTTLLTILFAIVAGVAFVVIVWGLLKYIFRS